METKVNVIPATIKLNNEPVFNNIHKRRVVAYARVSTDSDEQETSFEAQNEYYTNYINSRPDWTLISIYSEMKIAKMIQFEKVNPARKARNKGF